VSRVVPLAWPLPTKLSKIASLDYASMSLDEQRKIRCDPGSGGAREFSEEQYRLWHRTSNR
jgi:hypothetical protein